MRELFTQTVNKHYMSTLQAKPRSSIMDRGGSPVCVRAVLGNDHLQLAQPTHRCSVSAGGELQKEALLLLTKRVQCLPKLPTMQTVLTFQNTKDPMKLTPILSSNSISNDIRLCDDFYLTALVFT